MQKVFLECASLDKRCYDEYSLSEDILQEHAASGMDRYIRDNFANGRSVLIVAGGGNNGADGMALARLLYGDFDVRLYLASEPKSDMAKIQLDRLSKIGITICDELHNSDVIVDAILGTGQNRELDNSYVKLIDTLNSLCGFKISCDIPTGVNSSGNIDNIACNADVTIAMGALKVAYFSDISKDFMGELKVVNLGVPKELYEGESGIFLLDAKDINLPSRVKKNSHKGTFGHAVIFCGEKEGAGIISGKAAYRFGAGLTTLVMLEKNYHIPPYLMHSYIPPLNTTAIAIGMGLGNHFEESFLDKHIASNNIPLVIDADALYNPNLLNLLIKPNKPIVMTPHPKEFIYMWKALSGEDITLEHLQANRFEYVQKFSTLFPDIVLLFKGASMLISHGKTTYINPHGNSKLSKGGSGDVLSGLIVSLLAQGYSPLDAAISGSLALSSSSNRYEGASYSMSSMDLIDNLALLK